MLKPIVIVDKGNISDEDKQKLEGCGYAVIEAQFQENVRIAFPPAYPTDKDNQPPQ